jgi:hypothetical protein
MPEYRVYTIGSDERILSRVDLVCENHEAAQEQAKQLVDGHDIELWHLDQRIAIFPHSD